jgi:hypothetical protein
MFLAAFCTSHGFGGRCNTSDPPKLDLVVTVDSDLKGCHIPDIFRDRYAYCAGDLLHVRAVGAKGLWILWDNEQSVKSQFVVSCPDDPTCAITTDGLAVSVGMRTGAMRIFAADEDLGFLAEKLGLEVWERRFQRTDKHLFERIDVYHRSGVGFLE